MSYSKIQTLGALVFSLSALPWTVPCFGGTEFEAELAEKLPQIRHRYDEIFEMKRNLLRTLGPDVAQSKGSSEYQAMIAIEKDYIKSQIAPLARKYAWAIPNEAALEAIKKYSPILEIGGGTGYWAYLLSQRGVDILSYDDASWDQHPTYKREREWFPVLPGDEHQIIRHPERTLFLCWPPKGETYPLAYRSLLFYQGQIVVYIGEGIGGATADPAFFQFLESEFTKIESIEIPHWPGFKDQLSVYERRRNSSPLPGLTHL